MQTYGPPSPTPTRRHLSGMFSDPAVSRCRRENSIGRAQEPAPIKLTQVAELRSTSCSPRRTEPSQAGAGDARRQGARRPLSADRQGHGGRVPRRRSRRSLAGDRHRCLGRRGEGSSCAAVGSKLNRALGGAREIPQVHERDLSLLGAVALDRLDRPAYEHGFQGHDRPSFWPQRRPLREFRPAL